MEDKDEQDIQEENLIQYKQTAVDWTFKDSAYYQWSRCLCYLISSLLQVADEESDSKSESDSDSIISSDDESSDEE